MKRATCFAALALAAGLAGAQAGPAPIDAGALPLAAKRLPASADECAVWRRERSFAASVEAHDARAFASHLHPGAVFNAGSPEPARGIGPVAQSWAEIVEGKTVALRWRPGIVHIGGDPAIAVSRGPWIMQATRDGAPVFNVGFFQSIWVRDAKDGSWRILFDAGASTPIKMADRAAAEAWVAEQAMADCAG
ncbi:MAG: YybH family protein [Caldimonas sp.]